MKSLLMLCSLAAFALAQTPTRPTRPTLDQMPVPLRPYLECTEKLEGMQQSLTTQIAMSLGIALERKALGRDFREQSEANLENWNEQVGALLEVLGPRAGMQPIGGALYYDTGVMVDRATGAGTFRRYAELRLVPDDRFAERFMRRKLIAGMCSRDGLAEDEAKQLLEILTKETGELGDADDPWLGHAHTNLMFMSLGDDFWKSYAAELIEKGTPFGTFDEFQTTLGEHVRAALVDPLRPRLDKSEQVDRNFRYEGDVIVIVHPVELETWSVPQEAIAMNSADRGAILALEVGATKAWKASSKHKRIRIGMIAGGAHHTLYDGVWPLR